MSSKIGKWPAVPIANLCEAIVDCVNKTAPTVEEATPYRMIRTTNVRNGRIDTRAVRYVDSATYQKWSRRGDLRVGDIVLTREAPLGEVGLLRDAEGVFLGQRLVMYRADEAVSDNRFLAYALQSQWVQAEIRSFGSGATVEHMRVPDCERIRVPAPPLRIQKKIGATLGAIDDLIENNQQRIEILEEMARLIYREWFVHFRFPGHENVDLGDSDLGPIPEGWQTAMLGDVAFYISRGIAPKYDEDSPSLVINQRCIRDHRISLDVARRHIKKVPDEKFVRLGDVLVNSTGVGTLGRVAPVRVELDDTTVDSHVTIVRPSAEINIDYFAELVLYLEPLFESLGVGSTGQTELSRARIGEAQVVVAPKPVRDSYGELVSPMSQLAVTLSRQNEVLAEARDLLLPRLISGELDVSGLDLDLEPVA